MAQDNDGIPPLLQWIAAIVVVLILAAILFPVFARARSGSGRSCSSNMRQLGLCLFQYCQDNDGRWPDGADHWAGQMFPYDKSTQVYECPDDLYDTPPGLYVCSYAMSANLPGQNVTDLTDASATVAMTEIDGTPPLDVTKPERISLFTDGATPNTAWGGIRMGSRATPLNPPRHDPSVMFLECDSHVKLLAPSTVSSGRDNPSATGAQDGFHAAGTKVLGGTYKLTFSER